MSIARSFCLRLISAAMRYHTRDARSRGSVAIGFGPTGGRADSSMDRFAESMSDSKSGAPSASGLGASIEFFKPCFSTHDDQQPLVRHCSDSGVVSRAEAVRIHRDLVVIGVRGQLEDRER